MRVAVVIYITLFLLATHSVFQWIVLDDYSVGRDIALSLCLYNGKVYVVGFDEADGFPVMRVEARDRSMGALLGVWRGSMGTLYDCVVNGGNIYVVGTVNISGSDFGWIVIAFNENLGVVSMDISNPSDGMDIATSIYSDGVYIYVAGIVEGSNFSGYRIERRALENLDVKAVYTIEFPLSWRRSYASPKITGQNDLLLMLYLYVDSKDIEVPRVEILDKDLRHVKTIVLDDIKGYPYAIISTQEGYTYLGGSMGVVKIDGSSRVLKERKLNGYIIFRLIYTDDRILAFGTKIIAPYYISMNSLFVFNSNLDIVANITISTSSPWVLWTGKMAVDESSIYVAASEYRELEPRPANEIWAIYSINRTEVERIQINKAENIWTTHIYLIIIAIVFAAVILGKIMVKSFKRVFIYDFLHN